MSRRLRWVLLVMAMACLAVQALEESVSTDILSYLPVKEVTVFKDGHALVRHEGQMATDAHGYVVMSNLPSPIIGTFWPYVAEKSVRLGSVVSGERRVKVERPVQNLLELIDANPGVEGIVTECGVRYSATILGRFGQVDDSEELETPTSSTEILKPKGNFVVVKTADGVRLVDLSRIEDIKFNIAPKLTTSYDEHQPAITLRLDWDGKDAREQAKVGMVYLQKGIRWIPGYQVEIDGKGMATIKLQATILNELADLDNAKVNLVIGVPSFVFEKTLDPIPVRRVSNPQANLSEYFRVDQYSSQLVTNMAQVNIARTTERTQPNAPAQAGMDLGPEMGTNGKSEDLFILHLPPLTLKRGERMVLPVAEYTIPYEDIYTVDLPYLPPRDIFRQLGTDQQTQLARMLASPKVEHKIRLHNTGAHPLTTAPAIIFNNGTLLGQGMMTYTALGATSDLTLTTAIDVQVRRTDQEVARTPNAETWEKYQYARVDMAGTVMVYNNHGKPVTVEVTRHVLGNLDNAGQEGTVAKTGFFEEGLYLMGADKPAWWNWYSWPNWWSRFNGAGQVTWKVEVKPGEKKELDYTWHYFWR